MPKLIPKFTHEQISSIATIVNLNGIPYSDPGKGSLRVATNNGILCERVWWNKSTGQVTVSNYKFKKISG